MTPAPYGLDGRPHFRRWRAGHRHRPQVQYETGFLYSANVAGGSSGCLLAGFYLLRVFDMAVATYAAVAINVGVALSAAILASRPVYSMNEPAGVSRPHPVSGATLVYGANRVVGADLQLGAEVVWTRLLSLLLGPTVYTFSIILAVFLLGLWAGSSAGSSLARRAGTSAAGAWPCARSCSPERWPGPATPWRIRFPTGRWTPGCRSIRGSTLSWIWCARHGRFFQANPAYGAPVFPWLWLLCGPRRTIRHGPPAGSTRSNTAVSIVGSLAFSLWLIPTVGSRVSQQILIAIAILAAIAGAASVSAYAWRTVRFAGGGRNGCTVGLGTDYNRSGCALGKSSLMDEGSAPIIRAFDLYDRANPT